jgi:hypothetical protein
LSTSLRCQVQDGHLNDNFGISVSLGPDLAIVGALVHPWTASIGAAYVYRYDGVSWTQEAELLASDGEDGDFFGSSVAVSGEVALVGAPGADASRGAAYAFRNSGHDWMEEARIVAGDGLAYDFFGSVSLQGDRAVIGAVKGACYVYRYNPITAQWKQQGEMVVTSIGRDDEFSKSTFTDTSHILIGAPGDDNYEGTVYTVELKSAVWDNYWTGWPGTTRGADARAHGRPGYREIPRACTLAIRSEEQRKELSSREPQPRISRPIWTEPYSLFRCGRCYCLWRRMVLLLAFRFLLTVFSWASPSMRRFSNKTDALRGESPSVGA